MGLTKRGSHGNGGLTVSELLVQQTGNFTVHDTSQFVTLIIPTAQILQTKVRNTGSDHRVGVTCVCHICFLCKKLSMFFLLHHKDPLQADKNLKSFFYFPALRRKPPAPAAVLQGRCCALLQGDKSQNALERGEHATVHRLVRRSSTHKAKVVINYRGDILTTGHFTVETPGTYFCLSLGQSII